MIKDGQIVLVTGAAGFIGSSLVRRLLEMGCAVRGLDNLSTGKYSNLSDVLPHPRFTFIEGDICDKDACIESCENVSFVLHQAALGSVTKSMLQPDIYVKNNIAGFDNILEAAVLHKVKRFVFASSSSVYGDNNDPIKTEPNTGNVLSPYAMTKKFNEEYANLFYRIYGIETIALRYFNVFGERQDPDSSYAAVIPMFIKALINDQPPTIYGDGEQSRDFIYVTNVIQANLLACAAPSEACGQAYNIACGRQVSINQLCKMLASALNKDIAPVYEPEREGDIKKSLADLKNSREKLNYHPVVDIETGLANTIKWYQDYYGI